MYRTIKKHEQVLENSLKTIIKALAYASSTFSNYDIDANEITIDFDDSIIEDKGAQQIRAQTEVANGTRSKKSYMKEFRNLNDEQIKKEMQQIASEKKRDSSMFEFPIEE